MSIEDAQRVSDELAQVLDELEAWKKRTGLAEQERDDALAEMEAALGNLRSGTKLLQRERGRTELMVRKARNIASDIRFALRDDAHREPEFAEGHKRILEICAERLEGFAAYPKDPSPNGVGHGP
jgi:hypothetical protein